MQRLLNIKPSSRQSLLLGGLPLVGLILVYVAAAAERHALNPSDKLLPTAAAIMAAIDRMAFTVDPMRGTVPMVADTVASLGRLGMGLAIATAITLVLGLVIGLLPVVRAAAGKTIATISVIPPIALLPILFIVMGLGEASKITLIVLGITPVMVRDLAGHVAAIPEEQLVKAQSLGGSTWQILLRVGLPQALPRLIVAIRLALGPAWVFLISAEAIASDVGLGYRIFLVRRYLAMDVIIPYVIWISLLALAADFALAALSRGAFPWAHEQRR